MWGIGVSGARILGSIIRAITVRCVGGRRGVNCIPISHDIDAPFRKYLSVHFSPDDKKWSSGEMVETTAVAVAAGATEAKNMASIVASWSRVEVWLVASFAALLFILLILCFSVQVFFINVFSFKRLINLKRLFLEDKENKVTGW